MTCNHETWRPVCGHELYYEVSDCGRVRSLLRMTRTGARGGHLLSPRADSVGYVAVHLCARGQRRVVRVHQLVLEAFIGPRPVGMECCHANSVRVDNRLENLRWDTHKANSADMVAQGRARGKVMRGEDNPNASITTPVARAIYAAALTSRQADVARRFGVTKQTVNAIVRRKAWSHATEDMGGG